MAVERFGATSRRNRRDGTAAGVLAHAAALWVGLWAMSVSRDLGLGETLVAFRPLVVFAGLLTFAGIVLAIRRDG